MVTMIHDHGLGTPCVSTCGPLVENYEVETLPLTEPERTERMEHNHVFQYQHGSPDCPACDTIDPMRMTVFYARKFDAARASKKLPNKGLAYSYDLG
jgi:hypothetical protein